MTKHDIDYAKSQIKDYCDDLCEEIQSQNDKIEDLENEISELKKLLDENGIEYQ